MLGIGQFIMEAVAAFNWRKSIVKRHFELFGLGTRCTWLCHALVDFEIRLRSSIWSHCLLISRLLVSDWLRAGPALCLHCHFAESTVNSSGGTAAGSGFSVLLNIPVYLVRRLRSVRWNVVLPCILMGKFPSIEAGFVLVSHVRDGSRCNSSSPSSSIVMAEHHVSGLGVGSGFCRDNTHPVGVLV